MRFISFSIAVLMVTGCLITGSAFGEYYRYVDEKGVVCYTDDPSQIPEQKLEKSDVYEEITAPPSQEMPGNKPNDPVYKAESNKETESAYDSLKRVNTELETEYFVLKSERDVLMQQSKEEMSDSETAAYNERVQQLNDRTRDYMKRKSTYMEQVKTYYNTVQ